MWRCVALGLMLASAATGARAQDEGGMSAADMRKMYKELGSPGLEGKALKKAIAAAEKSPLGSALNPVRVSLPAGERYYLGRLRCMDGAAPAFDRSGSVGEGPYGYILDLYAVTCPGKAPVQVYMDMYHDQSEARPVPGFTVISD
jgi:hypothetical protein